MRKFFKENKAKIMIYLLCSTIRPNVFSKTHKVWIDRCKNVTNIKTKVVVDHADHADILKDFDTLIYTGGTKGITKPLTTLTQTLTYLDDDDIIVVMSDDYFPPQDWDIFLINRFKNYTGAINIYEGRPQVVQDNIVTIPIMDVKTLRKLNYVVYHPDYTHMFSDNELHDVLSEMELLKNCNSTTPRFEHKHWSLGGRTSDSHDKALTNALHVDKKIYEQRKRLPLVRKLEYTIVGNDCKMLSILICSLNSRHHQLEQLISSLQKQRTPSVEILVCKDNGEMTIGKKRNYLLKKATGKYICYIDDDDSVADNYIQYILLATQMGSDCIGIEGIITTNGVNPMKFIHSVAYKTWETDRANKTYLRCPNHLNPVLRSLALKVGFDDNKSNGEDADYSNRLRSLLVTETYIKRPIYNYIFTTGVKNY